MRTTYNVEAINDVNNLKIRCSDTTRTLIFRYCNILFQ